RIRLGNLRTDLARCQAGGRARLAFGAPRDALGGALLLILLALSLVRRGFLIGWHYLALRFRIRRQRGPRPYRRRVRRSPSPGEHVHRSSRSRNSVAGSCRWAAWFQRDNRSVRRSAPAGHHPCRTSRAVERGVKRRNLAQTRRVWHWTIAWRGVTPALRDRRA